MWKAKDLTFITMAAAGLTCDRHPYSKEYFLREFFAAVLAPHSSPAQATRPTLSRSPA
jgi:hypothetical protein